MNLSTCMCGLYVLFAAIIMKVITIPIKPGSKEYNLVNNTVQLSKVAMTLRGSKTVQSGPIMTVSGADTTETINSVSLSTEDGMDMDYDYENINDTGSPDTTPEYMLELYSNMSLLSSFLHDSNIIRSFKHMPHLVKNDEFTNTMQSIDCYGCRTHSLHFDISTISKTESINLAELRLYTLIKRDQHSFMGVSRLVKIYEVMDIKDRYGIPKYNFITSKYVHKLENAWESFDVTSVLKRSLQTGSKTEHLEVRIHSMLTEHSDDNLDIDANPNHIKQPILVVYSNDIRENERIKDRHEIILHEISSKKSASHRYFTQATDLSGNIDNKYGLPQSGLSRTKRSKGYNRNSGCRRRPMYVNFADIEYDSWIIAPRGYQAYQCAGRCWFPISENLSPSNHAVIQTLLNMKHHKRAGRACCVPTELAPISLLYIDKQGVVTYKYMFDGMVVSKCGCR